MLKRTLLILNVSAGFCLTNTVNWVWGGPYSPITQTTSDSIKFVWSEDSHNIYISAQTCPSYISDITENTVIADPFDSTVIYNTDTVGYYCIYCAPHYSYMKFNLHVTEPPGGSGDPHLVLANGQTTDFRGVNNTYFNFITSPGFGFNIKTNEADFMFKKVLVHGSFMTEAHVFTEEAKVSLFGEKIGKTNIVLVNGTCGLNKFKLGPHRLLDCKTTRIKTEYSSFVVSTSDWSITLRLNFVYNRLKGPFNRIDFEVEKLNNVESHGIIGQSYYLDKDIKGETDIYPLEGEFTTYSMANGVIDGSYKDYIVSGPYDYTFKYSKYIDDSFATRISTGSKIVSN